MKLNITLDEALAKASPLLREKIIYSVELVRKSQRIADVYDKNDGFWVGFSGGKDSQALLGIVYLAGAKFKAHYSPTTIDPPEVVKFIRRNYPEVEFGKVEKNIYDMTVQKGLLPTRIIRWCCAEYKEKGGEGKVTLVGVRRQESIKRSKYKDIGLMSRKFSGTMEQFEEYREAQLKKKVVDTNFDQFSEHTEQMVGCINGKDKLIVSPLLDWLDSDVWSFLNDVLQVPHCSLYDEGFSRLGCVGCPMANKHQKRIEFARYPHMKAKWIKTIERIMADKEEGRLGYCNFEIFPNPAEACFEWWISNESFEEWKEKKLHPKLELDFDDEE